MFFGYDLCESEQCAAALRELLVGVILVILLSVLVHFSPASLVLLPVSTPGDVKEEILFCFGVIFGEMSETGFTEQTGFQKSEPGAMKGARIDARRTVRKIDVE